MSEQAAFSTKVGEGAHQVSMELKMESEHMMIVLDKAHGMRTQHRIGDDGIQVSQEPYDYEGASKLISTLHDKPAASSAGGDAGRKREREVPRETALDIDKLEPRKLGDLLGLAREMTRDLHCTVSTDLPHAGAPQLRISGQLAGGRRFDLRVDTAPGAPASPAAPTVTGLDEDAHSGAEVVVDNQELAAPSGLVWRSRLTGGDDPDSLESENDFNLVKVSTGLINVVAGNGIINFGIAAVGAVLLNNQVDTRTPTQATGIGGSPVGGSPVGVGPVGGGGLPTP